MKRKTFNEAMVYLVDHPDILERSDTRNEALEYMKSYEFTHLIDGLMVSIHTKDTTVHTCSILHMVFQLGVLAERERNR